jgi:beta-lactamase superfamily II metal-dependent hydrolase
MAKATTKKTTNTVQKLAVDNVSVRMYCMGTGDCLVLKFMQKKTVKYTMLIDCGSCRGDQEDFDPYIKDLKTYVKNKIDLLVITHEHNDHVNGFAKCSKLFDQIAVKEAWFAWTEDPEDPDGLARDLLTKRNEMRVALRNAINAVEECGAGLQQEELDAFGRNQLVKANRFFRDGLNSLAAINLADNGEEEAGAPKPLAGMTAIKTKLAKMDKIKPKYLHPGDSIKVSQLPGIKFHVLGPPSERDQVFKEGKEGRDVFNKHLSLSGCSSALHAFKHLGSSNIPGQDVPFASNYIFDSTRKTVTDSADPVQSIMTKYKNAPWRKIDNDWLNSAGSLAIRLNSHINNTSLALAIEFGDNGKVVLLPGDAEYGSWESWHLIEKWKNKGPGGKHFTEDLLNRTVFYKVAHHLSYNGTALDKGILMMNSEDLVAMATLDRLRIVKGWKSTMPNVYLLKELMKRCKGRVYIMSEDEINNAPSSLHDPVKLDKGSYEQKVKVKGGKDLLYKQYTIKIN